MSNHDIATRKFSRGSSSSITEEVDETIPGTQNVTPPHHYVVFPPHPQLVQQQLRRRSHYHQISGQIRIKSKPVTTPIIIIVEGRVSVGIMLLLLLLLEVIAKAVISLAMLSLRRPCHFRSDQNRHGRMTAETVVVDHRGVVVVKVVADQQVLDLDTHGGGRYRARTFPRS